MNTVSPPNPLSLIAYALAQHFPKTEIHKEQIADIMRPAFFVMELKTSQNKAIGNRYYRESLLVVRYFPPEDNLTDYEDLMSIADKLYAVLEYLSYDGYQARGYQMNHRIEDNVLQFFVKIRMALERPEHETKMANIDVDTEVKQRTVKE